MDAELRRYLNAILVLFSILVGTIWARIFTGPLEYGDSNALFILFALFLACVVGLVIYVIFVDTEIEWRLEQKAE